MAVNLADAWKSHILQDFQFPQEFPQCEASAGAVRDGNLDAAFLQKWKFRLRLTPKLLQRYEVV